ncbi:hypothetical protein Q3G72_014102 [Acer saccharum]|nr:hypothetical protein Q3G72_014102 [Acer saccharum]
MKLRSVLKNQETSVVDRAVLGRGSNGGFSGVTNADWDGKLDKGEYWKNEVDLTIESISATVTDDKVRKKSGINGTKISQWKKAARRSSVVERGSVQELSCVKRKEVASIDYFFDGTKITKINSLKSGSKFLLAGKMPLAHRSQ